MAITNINLITVLKEITSNLLNKQVEYLIVGGTAVNAHGYNRLSVGLAPGVDFDIDIWYNPQITNFINLSKAVQLMGVKGAEDLDKIIFDPNKTYLRLTHGNYKMDFLPTITGFERKEFISCYNRRKDFDLNGNIINVIGYSDLIKSKKVLSRELDLKDIVQLEKLKDRKSKGFSM